MNDSTKLLIIGATIAGATLATIVTIAAPGVFVEHFSSFFESWFNGLSHTQQQTVTSIGRYGFPALGGVIGAIGAAVHAKRKKVARGGDEI